MKLLVLVQVTWMGTREIFNKFSFDDFIQVYFIHNYVMNDGGLDIYTVKWDKVKK